VPSELIAPAKGDKEVLTFFKNLCIMAMALINRLLYCLLEILVWLDQGLGLILCIPFYLVLGHPKPNADVTISSVVGFYAINDYKWALVAEWIIDRLFYVFEGKLGHCRKHVEYEDIDWEEAAKP
jgi:hypothetical protein